MCGQGMVGAPFFSSLLSPLPRTPSLLSPPHGDTLLPPPALAQPLPPSPQPRLPQASRPSPRAPGPSTRPHLLPQQLPHVPQRRVGLLQFAQHLRAQVCTCTDRGRWWGVEPGDSPTQLLTLPPPQTGTLFLESFPRSPAAACFLHPARPPPTAQPPGAATPDLPRTLVSVSGSGARWGRGGEGGAAYPAEPGSGPDPTHRGRPGRAGARRRLREPWQRRGAGLRFSLPPTRPAGPIYPSGEAGPRDGPPPPCPASSRKVNSQFKAPPGMDLVGKLSHRGPVRGVSGVERQVGPPSSPPIHLLIQCLLYAKPGAAPSTHTWGNSQGWLKVKTHLHLHLPPCFGSGWLTLHSLPPHLLQNGASEVSVPLFSLHNGGNKRHC